MRIFWLLPILIGLTSCTTLFPERNPAARVPQGVKEVSFSIIAWNDQCYPSVILVDRDGRSVLISVTFRSDGKDHVISIPAFGIRRYVKQDEEATVKFLAERSGIFPFDCGPLPFPSPLGGSGRIAIK
ncbi:MAG: hypothetical protein HY347_10925 [candidate division NC10 bacterium]|nr:hypothetical protein [candidate division NC10 bacterium]